MSSIFDQTRIQASKVKDPFANATATKPKPGTWQVPRVFLWAEPKDLAAFEGIGFTLLPEGLKSLKGKTGDERNGAFVLPSGTGSVFLKFEGDFTPAPSGGDEYTSVRAEAMFPIAPKPGMRENGWKGWVRGGEEKLASLFACLGHPLRPNADLNRLMPAVNIDDAAGCGIDANLMAILEDIVATFGQGPVSDHCGAYMGKDSDGRAECRIVSGE